MNQTLQQKDQKETYLSKVGLFLAVVIAAIMAGILIYLSLVPNVALFQRRENENLYFLDGGSGREVQREDSPLGVVKEYRFTIEPEQLNHDSNLIFHIIHQYAEVYLEEELLLRIEYPEENRLGGTFGDNWVQIPLYREDAGKEIRVQITPVYESFRNHDPVFMLGSRYSVYTHQLREDLPQIVLSVLTVLAGIIYIVIAIYLGYKRRRYEKTAMLGLFSVLIGGWKFCDCIFAAFLMPDRTALLFYLSICMLMLSALPLIRYIRMVQRRSPLLDSYYFVLAAVLLVQLLLQITGVYDLRETLPVTHLMFLFGIVCVIISRWEYRAVFEMKKEDIRSLRLLSLCILGAIIDVALFYIMGSSSELIFSLISFLLYVVVDGIYSLRDYQEQEKRLAAQEKELTEQRFALITSQIQPHFIYNTLGTIRYLCMTEPEKAADVVQEFSLYLRVNLGELNSHGPIRISREMEHVKHYITIEQIRFPDMEVEFDLRADDFMLPALSVQPLVENAVKHGLMGLETGGKVRISTFETTDAYCVRVEDNGVGFDTEKKLDTTKHIGIQNIRGRLEVMCNGSLTIESKVGQGTSALIRIPREEKPL